MKALIMEELCEETNEEQRTFLMGELRQLQASAAKIGIDEQDESFLKVIDAKQNNSHGEKVRFPFYLDPNGAFRSRIRNRRQTSSIQGTSSNIRDYLQNNVDKFEAYDEMERRILTLYNEISIDKYNSISKQLRILD